MPADVEELRRLRACTSFWGHQYRPRFDEVPTGEKSEDSLGRGFTAGEVRSLIVRRVYLCDVCTRCGDVIDRVGA